MEASVVGACGGGDCDTHAVATGAELSHGERPGLGLTRLLGGLAWIVERRSFAQGPGSPVRTYQVHKVDRGGRQRLDAGADVDPESLTLSGATISWRRGGVTRTAVLGSAPSG